MFAITKTRSARTLLALTAATTVGMTGLSGAQAAERADRGDQDVEVEVCKEVVGRNGAYHPERDRRDRNTRFWFNVRVNGEFQGSFFLTARRADSCTTLEEHDIEVERGDRVRVRELRTEGYRLKEFNVDGARDVVENDNSVRFRVGRQDISVEVVNQRLRGGDH